MSKKVITFYDSEKQAHDFPIVTPDYGVCDTNSDVADKIVTCDDFSLFTGAEITVKFNKAPTTDVIKLNVNDSGAIAVDFSACGNKPSEVIKATGCYGFVYDGTSWIYKGSGKGTSKEELERLEYYGDMDIIPSDESYFTVNETGETITGLTDTGKTQTELVIPYEINGKKITTLCGSDGTTGRPPASFLDGNNVITKVVIPNSVINIKAYAFDNRSSLTSINIPNSVTSIGNNAFSGCSSLKSITIPNTITSIGDFAFNNCRSLTSITIPDSITNIENSAIANCTGLTLITIPNSVKSIEGYAFANCISLTSINIPSSVKSIEGYTFFNCPSNFTIYCEQGSYAETYAKTNNIPIMYTDIKATLVGQKTAKGGEIFNDYENNIAEGLGAHAEGKETEAGKKAFKIINITHSDNKSILTLDNVDGITAGKWCYIMTSNAYDYIRITNVDVTNKTITVNVVVTKLSTTNANYVVVDSTANKADTGITIGDGSHAEGIDTNAYGDGSHAEGSKTTAGGMYSHAEGYKSIAGYLAHAEGFHTRAIGDGSHAEGNTTQALGEYSHSEGNGSIASGDQAHAEGMGTTASGKGSHAEGYYTEATGTSSHAEGKNTIASSDYQHVQGINNIKDTTNKYAHIVGNGSPGGTDRSNAHTLDWSGNAWYAGNIKIGGTGYDDTNAKTIATIDDVKSNLSTVYKIKGSLDPTTTNSAYITDLIPNGPENGYVYNISATSSIGLSQSWQWDDNNLPEFETTNGGTEYTIKFKDSSIIQKLRQGCTLNIKKKGTDEFWEYDCNGRGFYYTIIDSNTIMMAQFEFDALTTKPDATYYLKQINTNDKVPVTKGDNVVWVDGYGWDKLAADVDLSNYYVKTDVNNLLAKKADKQTKKGGFVGGQGASAGTSSNPLNTIQLGAGTNINEFSMQVYDYQLLANDAETKSATDGSKYLKDVGKLSNLSTTDKTDIVSAINTITNNTTIISNSNGGFAAGKDATVSEIVETGGVAIGNKANTQDGVAIGNGASCANDGGIAIGNKANAKYDGVAIGKNALTSNGVSIGEGAHNELGVAIGKGALIPISSGIAIGDGAIVVCENDPAEAIQIGAGTNENDYTARIYDYQLLADDATTKSATDGSKYLKDVGKLSDLTTTNKTNVVSAINEVKDYVDNKVPSGGANASTVTSCTGDELAAITSPTMGSIRYVSAVGTGNNTSITPGLYFYLGSWKKVALEDTAIISNEFVSGGDSTSLK